MAYDSRADTLKHSLRVGELIVDVIGALCDRAVHHDLSKTESPEREAFDEHTPTLQTLTYGTEEYRAELRAMKPAVEHHYRANRHHPQHFPDGVAGMTLVDLAEMLADWKAAGERHGANDIGLRASLEIQRDRFGLSEQLYAILQNTAFHLGWLDTEDAG
jgi:hypothetical protein